MPEQPSFVPRSFLEHSDDFGLDADATWRLASNLDEAIRLFRAIEQHRLALGLNRLLRRNKNSIGDLARPLHRGEDTLWRKLRGLVPAAPDDVVLSSWIVGKRPTQTPLATRGTDESSIELPGWPLLRARDR